MLLAHLIAPPISVHHSFHFTHRAFPFIFSSFFIEWKLKRVKKSETRIIQHAAYSSHAVLYSIALFHFLVPLRFFNPSTVWIEILTPLQHVDTPFTWRWPVTAAHTTQIEKKERKRGPSSLIVEAAAYSKEEKEMNDECQVREEICFFCSGARSALQRFFLFFFSSLCRHWTLNLDRKKPPDSGKDSLLLIWPIARASLHHRTWPKRHYTVRSVRWRMMLCSYVLFCTSVPRLPNRS